MASNLRICWCDLMSHILISVSWCCLSILLSFETYYKFYEAVFMYQSTVVFLVSPAQELQNIWHLRLSANSAGSLASSLKWPAHRNGGGKGHAVSLHPRWIPKLVDNSYSYYSWWMLMEFCEPTDGTGAHIVQEPTCQNSMCFFLEQHAVRKSVLANMKT